jgi:hypothetical protein
MEHLGENDSSNFAALSFSAVLYTLIAIKKSTCTQRELLGYRLRPEKGVKSKPKTKRHEKIVQHL